MSLDFGSLTRMGLLAEGVHPQSGHGYKPVKVDDNSARLSLQHGTNRLSGSCPESACGVVTSVGYPCEYLGISTFGDLPYLARVECGLGCVTITT